MDLDFFKLYYSNYYPFLNQRQNTFTQMFMYLESLNKEKYLIVETGTTRDINNLEGEGNSTILFDLYLNHQKDGVLYTVDISPTNCAVAQKHVSNKTTVILGDSVNFLHKFPNPEDIDLLYLDSFDFNRDDPHPSSFHHMQELTAIYSKLKSGCLIVIDDNFNGMGKGKYVAEFLDNVGDKLYFNEYQVGYIKK